jgi:predicted O-linked N-acetylglucosamine transferase (SPINDLY family)
MKYKALLISLLTIFFVQMAEGNVSNTHKTVSSKEFLRAIATKIGEKNKGIYSWKMPHSEEAFIWYPEKNSWTSAGFERTGKVYFTNNGKITHRVVLNSIIDGYWEVKFIGNKNKISLITLVPNELSEENPKLEIEKLFIKQKMLCTRNAEEKSVLYKLKYPQKKSFWVKSLKINSSTGRGEIYQISFGEKPACKIEDESAGKKQKYITKCIQFAGTQKVFEYINEDQAIGACEIAVEISPDNAQVLYALGRAYKKSGNDKKALLWYKKASELNNADAKHALGKMFINGEGVKKNRLFAKIMFEGAMEQGSVDAMVWLGVLYVQGIDGKKNYNEAEKLFRKAISLGSINAKKNLRILNDLKQREKEIFENKKLNSKNSNNEDSNNDDSKKEDLKSSSNIVEYQ